ncbi:MAG: peptidoglycan editing factor PgeF [Alphaproteobacteria bacterium]|nr:peptidoglycan editing factor PgeF [Alphaproteobacteria bacterium]
MITLDLFNNSCGIRHAFFTRQGGLSRGVFKSLNCGFGSGDAPGTVAGNRAIAAEQLGFSPDRLVTCYQVHSNTVITVEAPWPHQEAPRADGLVARTPGIALGILTADCAPILFADASAEVIGAAHSGWRGALDGVLEATVGRMEALGANRGRIRAGIGPCIARASYEVGPEFCQRFLKVNPENAEFFSPASREDHFMFDLPGYVEHRLARAGITKIERTTNDTVGDEALFFSYRRACLHGEPAYGRLLSAIGLGN